MSQSIADIRRDYMLQSLMEDDVAGDPFEQFSKWWNEAITSSIDEVNAMTLATATKDGLPDARIVLLKGFSKQGFVFFTNYTSRKGIQLKINPKATLIFFWKELERQVRISGIVEKVSEAESDAYFNSRPAASRIAAWASPQSKPIESRKIIEENFLKYSGKFSNDVIHRPPYWGGYAVKPIEVEFWQGRPGRLHDRILYTSQTNDTWKIVRLAP